MLFTNKCDTVIHILPPFNADIINYDSSYQYFLTRHSLSDIMTLLPEDYSPPPYTLLLKLWTCIFGSSLPAMRAFSVLQYVYLIKKTDQAH